MKLFGLFEKKKEIQMTVYILQLMNTYLEQCKGDIVLVKEEPEIENELKKLERLGLGNSENAKLLKIKMAELDQKKESSEYGQMVFEYIKSLGIMFPKSYLISLNQFYEILRKYNLTVGNIRDYTGVIPQKNIDEISMVKEMLKNSNNSIVYRMNSHIIGNLKYGYYYVKGINCTGRGNSEKLAIKLGKLLKSRGFIIKYPLNFSNILRVLDIHDTNLIKCNSWIDKETYTTEHWDDLTLRVSELRSNDLLIAAPEKCFSERFEIQKVPVDPIVFQCCPYGVVIHSVWGEEADDKVLKDYMELNQKILEL